MMKKLFHIPSKNTNCVCWFHFFFPPKYAIYPDGFTSTDFREDGTKTTHRVSYTFRHFFYSTILLGDYRCERRRRMGDFWERFVIPRNFVFQAGIIGFDTTTSDGLGGTSGSHSHTATGSNLQIFGGISTGGGTNDFSSVKYNNVGLTERVAETAFEPGVRSVWSLAGPATGANTFAWAKTESRGVQAISATYTGCKQVNPEATNTNSTTGTSLSVAITTISNNAWLAGIWRAENNNPSAGTNTTLRITENPAAWGDTNAGQTPPGSFSIQMTQAVSAGFMVAAVAFAPVAAAGVISSLPFLGTG